MRILSWNVRGSSSPEKGRAIKAQVLKLRPQFLLLQETKQELLTTYTISTWGLRNDWKMDFIPSIGNSGGIFSAWDTNWFSMTSIHKTEQALYWFGIFSSLQFPLCIINIYASCLLTTRALLWEELKSEIPLIPSLFICAGDFNEILHSSERSSGHLITSTSSAFISMMDSVGALDLSVGGSKYTWFGPGSQALRLDRFLLSPELLSSFNNLTQKCFPRGALDHRPLLLAEEDVDWGPKPFRFINCWLSHPSCLLNCKTVWDQTYTYGDSHLCLWTKLKAVKVFLKEWKINVFGCMESEIANLQNKIDGIDTIVEFRALTGSERSDRALAAAQLIHKSKLLTKIWRQRAKRNWVIKGDRCTKLYHLLANYRFSRNRITVIYDQGRAYDLPADIKELAAIHFAERFKKPSSPVFDLSNLPFSKLTPTQVAALERPFTQEEVFSAISNCKGDKAPGPDGLSFKFY